MLDKGAKELWIYRRVGERGLQEGDVYVKMCGLSEMSECCYGCCLDKSLFQK